ncbi:MAG TPA: hypothetical protein PL155_06900 [Candidatus Omnitrophota bacterium]|nr:hypothetical protein [Candidatus Omnitrophota bacterium]HPD85563.1 hypothetical protein [Candidatus Omnitrophota bacterium]HRZ04397.1 hypothetical protein [Candidatus Omnitrophota bacterium]
MNSKGSNETVSDFTFINIALLSLVSILEGVQILFVAGLISSFSPMPINPYGSFFPEAMGLLRPEREMLLYRVFIVSVLFIQALVLLIFKKRLAGGKFSGVLVRFAVVETLLVGLMSLVAFKMIIFRGADFFRYLFCFSLGLAAVVKIFWFKIDILIQRFFLRPGSGNGKISWVTRACDLLIPVLIFLVIFIPDREGAVAAMFAADGFLHFDSFIMAPAWAFAKGCIFYIDVITQYGMGLPILVSAICKLWGSFTYEHVLLIMILCSILYYILSYVLLRVWLKDVLISFIGVALMIKFQIFNEGADPFVWRTPSGTVLRYIFDIAFLLLLLGHVRHAAKRYLFGAALITGLSLLYMNDTGTYQLAALYTYLILLWLIPQCREKFCGNRKSILWTLMLFIIPIGVSLGLLWLLTGQSLWAPIFWKNRGEFIQGFLQGLGALPIYDNLLARRFLNFFIGLGIPLVYLFTVVFIGGLCFKKKISAENIFVITLGIYGLCLYHHYICRSVLANYYGAGIPFVLILCYWLDVGLRHVRLDVRRGVLAAVALGLVFTVMTMDAFLVYPNYFNRAKNLFAQNKKFIKEELSFEKDVALISRITSPREKVCLISGYETALLMAADRKPFFYFFPLLSSRSLKMKDFGGTYLYSMERFVKTIEQLETQRPEFVFIERKLFFGEIPAVYYSRHTTLALMVKYLREKYSLFEAGQYLVALKRK